MGDGQTGEPNRGGRGVLPLRQGVLQLRRTQARPVEGTALYCDAVASVLARTCRGSLLTFPPPPLNRPPPLLLPPPPPPSPRASAQRTC